MSEFGPGPQSFSAEHQERSATKEKGGVDFFVFADMVSANVSIERPAGRSNFWLAEFEDAETGGLVETKDSKESGILTSASGSGRTPERALADYARRIQGKILVMNATGGKKRREFNVPAKLTVPKLS